MKKEFIYVKDYHELDNVHVGDYGYHKGYFFCATRVLPRLAKSETCPCVSKSCAFNKEFRMSKTEGPCEFYRQCISAWRTDKDSVIFTSYTPTQEELTEFSAWCSTNNLPFSYDKKTD